MSTTYYTSQGDTLDYICWKFYGQQSGAVEAVLASNPGLSDLGPVLAANTRIELPQLTPATPDVQPIRLWG